MTYFHPEEFLCHCGLPDCEAPKTIEPLLGTRLDELRAAMGGPLLIVSGLRCAYWNRHEGGAPDSGHLTGQAADIACVDDRIRYALLSHIFGPPLFPGVEVAARHIHVDVRPRPAPWCGVERLGG